MPAVTEQRLEKESSKLNAIPTNVITGFLGVGKSTAILNLLRSKPADERWAVLVNEFGEVGIDGSLLSGQDAMESGVFIREVPGGCMCCAAGLPMQIALNLLLSTARPHRLLIEPTGLGHPQEVLATLAADHNRELLDLRATITLVDARKLSDERYTGHATFRQQLAIADQIVANKADQYDEKDFPRLLDFLEHELEIDAGSVIQATQGAFPTDCLHAPAREHHHKHHHHTSDESSLIPAVPELPPCGYLSIENQGEGFFSRGWIFKPEWIFDANKLYRLLSGIDAERIKGVFITEQGIIAFNKADEVLTQMELDDCLDSRIELICADKAILAELEPTLLECVAMRA